MRLPYKPGDLALTRAAILAIATDLPHLELEARKAWDETRADGYPTSSMNSGSPASVVDEEGVPMPPLNDPTGEAATANPDRTAHNLVTAWNLVRKAYENLEKARGLYLHTTTPKEEPEPEAKPSLDWCQVCATPPSGRFQGEKYQPVMNPTYRVRSYRPGQLAIPRCRKCDDWALAATQDRHMTPERPHALILLEARGKPITNKDFEATLLTEPA